MPAIHISLTHPLPQSDAAARMRQLLTSVKSEFADKISGLKENWQGNSCAFSLSAMGFAVSGSLQVAPATVTVACDLPFAAMLFRGPIENAIRQRAAALLR